jgi:glycosyltransferase involved in cell wall biosynthesis
VLIKGSGVDLEKYKIFDEPLGVPVITYVGRFLIDKGILEFVEASKILKKRGLVVRMCLVGEVDIGNPSSLKEEELNNFIEMGIIENWGFQKNINDVYAKSNIACLPSYREGLPKSLIEAAASSRAVITTDVPGCKDAILPGISGVLVPVKDSDSLANAIQFLIENTLIRRDMAKAGRLLAEKEFSIKKVIELHMKIYEI